MKYYTVILSTKNTLIIDETDYQKILELSASGNFIRVKQGIINPSFLVAILPKDLPREKVIEGHINEKTKKFVVTKEEEVNIELEDEFNPDSLPVNYKS